MRARTVAICALLVAAATFCPRPAQAIEVAREDGTLTLSEGNVAFRVDPATGAISVRCGEREATGKGVLLKVSPGEEGTPTVTDLAQAAKAGREVAVAGSDLVVGRVPLHARLPLAGIGAWDAGGGPTTLPVPLEALGFPRDAVLAGYDLAEDEFFGPLFGAFSRRVDGGRCALFAVGQAVDRPVLLCTSGSADGKTGELSRLGWDAKSNALSGTSTVAKGQRYELRLLAPPRPVRWVAQAATVSQADREAGAEAEVMQTRQWLRIYIKSPETRAVDWRVAFSRERPRELAAEQVHFSAEAQSARCVVLSVYGIRGEALIRRHDGVEFITSSGTLRDTSAKPDTAYTYILHPISWTGRQPAVAGAKATTPALPPLPPLPDVYLSDLEPLKAVNGWGGAPRRDKSIEENPIRIRGEVFERGMGVHAVSELVYPLKPAYQRFVAVVGVDDEKNDTPSGSVTFEVQADGKTLFKSPVLTPFDERVSIDVPIPDGAKQIHLLVGDGGDGIGCDHADWANAGFITK
ncbi:MAG: NPCBM/NEW2 domain-containing protein [Candidatus Brocadiia bacterium]